MKSIIGKDMTNYNQNRSFCINGKSTTNVSKIVNEFNNFFVSVGVDLAKKHNMFSQSIVICKQ